MSKELFDLKGVIATVITPFTEDGKIDHKSLERQIEFGLESGLAGFLVPCGASEIKYLDHDEQVSLFKTSAKVAKGKAFLMPNLPGPSKEEIVEQAKEYMALGADGLNINTKWSPRKGPEEEYYELVAAVNDLKPNFICLQDDDKYTPGIPVELATKMFNELDRLFAIKCETDFCQPKYTQIIKATGGKMLVYGANGSAHSLEAYDRGVHGFMPSGFFPLFVNLYRLYHEKSREAAAKFFFDFLPIIMFTRQHGSVNRITHKSYFKRLGIFDTIKSKDPDDFFDEYSIRYREEMIDRAIDMTNRMDEYWA